VKALDVVKDAVSLRKAVEELAGQPAAVLYDGRPVAVLLPVDGSDLETVSLSLNPQFLAILERSRARQIAEGGVSAEEMQRRLAADLSLMPAPRNDGQGRRRP
jgi:hypothetical protein